MKLPAAFALAFATSLAVAQEKPTRGVVEPGQAATQSSERSAGKDRVAALLRRTLGQRSYRFRSSYVGKAGRPQQAVLGGVGRVQVWNIAGSTSSASSGIEGVRDGETTQWTRPVGKKRTQLVNRGARWISRVGDAAWIPSRSPNGTWQTFLPDPSFLAERLLAMLDQSDWQYDGPGTLDDRPVRVYRVELDRTQSKLLQQTGAVGSAAVGTGQFLLRAVGGGGGGGFQMVGAGTQTYEILLEEDPKTKLPARIVVRTYQEGGGPQGAFVRGLRVQGGQKQGEEQEEDGKKKPVQTLEIRLSDVGKASLALDDEAVQLLAPPTANAGAAEKR